MNRFSEKNRLTEDVSFALTGGPDDQFAGIIDQVDSRLFLATCQIERAFSSDCGAL